MSARNAVESQSPAAAPPPSPHVDPIPPDCRGQNFYRLDDSLRELLALFLEPRLHQHLEPHLEHLGELAGGRLDELAAVADRNPPVLHPRDRAGHDREWIEYHPAYREMERIAFSELGLHAMSHRSGVLGWPAPLPGVAKYAFQYLFVQAEFGLLCPVSVSDTSAHLLARFGSGELKQRLLPRMLSQDPEQLWKGTQFMTEKTGGSDVGAITTVARREGSDWRLYGEKWFCSHADADVALLLARPEGAPAGTRGLALFAMPRRLDDGSRNRYRIVRLKDKLGTRSMASGEILLDGALAWVVGDPTKGFKQMMEQVNLSRLSHGVRAAGMMRRCLNEALQAARHRQAFGRPIVEHPLLRRRLLEILLPAEQALSFFVHTAAALDRAKAGDREAEPLVRVLTPLIKYQACRDNLDVATAAMEVRGGNGYIEDWVNPRLVRDAHIGVLWEGTSNIIALDVVRRAVRGVEGAAALDEYLAARLAELDAAPAGLRAGLATRLARALELARRVAEQPQLEHEAGRVASALYHATSAVLLAWEGERALMAHGDGRRLLLAALVIAQRLSPVDPTAVDDSAWGPGVATELLAGAPLPRDRVRQLLETCPAL